MPTPTASIASRTWRQTTTFSAVPTFGKAAGCSFFSPGSCCRCSHADPCNNACSVVPRQAARPGGRHAKGRPLGGLHHCDGAHVPGHGQVGPRRPGHDGRALPHGQGAPRRRDQGEDPCGQALWRAPHYSARGKSHRLDGAARVCPRGRRGGSCGQRRTI